MRDFTLKTYTLLLKKLKERDYTFLTFEQFLCLESTESFRGSRPDALNVSNRERKKLSGNSKISLPDINPKKFNKGFEMTNEGAQIPINSTTSNLPSPNPNQHICILRHDVDRIPRNALTTAKIENELGIRGTYYFRIVPKSFDEKIILQIADLGHEIGYHYEDVDLEWRNRKSSIGSGQWAIENNKSIEQSDKADKFSNEIVIDLAYESFCKNLEKLRQIVNIKTICMHGSPLSKYDNKLLWTKYNYCELGIIGEPYLDINWDEFGYLTDTGRRWDGVAIRDKVRCDKSTIGSPQSAISSRQSASSKSGIQYPVPSIPHSGRQNPTFRSTFDIIKFIDELPEKVMFTIHPERWTDDWLLWTRQLVLQNVKNVAKKVMIGIKSV